MIMHRSLPTVNALILILINGQLMNSPEVNSRYKYAGGGFLSTPTDVVTFAMAHINEGFLTSNSLAILFA